MLLYDQLKEKIAQRENITSEIKELNEKIAEAISPYKAGEEVPVKGYSYKGKMCRINNVRFKMNPSPDMTVYANLILKDGSNGREVMWSSWNDDVIATALETLK